MSAKSHTAWPGPLAGGCVCTAMRRATRSITAVYDKALAAVGLSVTQYAVLVRAGRTDGTRHSALAEAMGMDRTTLTRALQPLERMGLLEVAAGEDRRERVIRVTRTGRARAEAAYPLWEAAQKEMLARLGDRGWSEMRGLLTAVEKGGGT
ncbi:MAG: MarR family winged helix-turn-helix transcriptional regulator [Bryobacteraceae bacterium]